MKISLNTLSTMGALAMAFTPMIAMASSARAENTPVHVITGDLNLSRPADALRFHVRVNTAGRSFCAQDVGIAAQSDCRQAIQDEAVAGLSVFQRQDLRSAESRS